MRIRREGDLLLWDNCLDQHRAIRNYERPCGALSVKDAFAPFHW
jgi:hypothetical protein